MGDSGPTAVARRTDPSTSWEAARSVRRVTKKQAEVLALFVAQGSMTDEEARAKYEALTDPVRHPRKPTFRRQSVSGFRTRRSELVKAGLLRWTGETKIGTTGRKMRVWEAA